nr:hypothetical protein [Tanacetum cinerariifolium]
MVSEPVLLGVIADTSVWILDVNAASVIHLQEHVLDLQEAKAAQAKEIAALKKKGRTNDDEMLRVDDLAREEVVMETTTSIKYSAAPTSDVTEDEITMAQALAALKSVKPKVVDKGKAKIIKPKDPFKKKDQMRIDEEYARKL